MNLNEATLGTICAIGGGSIQTGPFGSQLHQSDYEPGGMPVVMPKDIVGGSVSETTVARVGSDHVTRLARHRLVCGDIVYGRRGDIGRHAFVTEKEQGWLCGTGCLRIRLGTGPVDPLFLHYYLEHEPVVGWIRGQAIGATLPNLNTSILESVPIVYPPLSTQRRIAAILSAYDGLIANNLRRIQILEEMAQRHYREWFVDYRFPGHEHARFVETAVGRVPEGWEVATLGTACESLQDGDWIETKDQGGSHYRLLQVSNIGVGEFIETGNFRFITKDTFRRLHCTEIVPGDILIARMPKPTGRAWLVAAMPWRMITAVDVAIARARRGRVTAAYLLHHLNSAENLSLVDKYQSGTTRPRISRRSLSVLPLVVPPLELQQQFERFLSHAYALQTTLRGENAVLRHTRDLLLPRLVSGEVDVSAISAIETERTTL